jgi:phospholipid-binding lipoprotein MlaA
MTPLRRAIAAALLALPVLAFGDDEAARTQAVDPFEGWNRGVFAFNDRLDEAVLKPLATGYRDAVPERLRDMIGNFFGNFGDAWSAVNHFLQGKPTSGIEMTMRVATNTVFGLGGLLDIATEAGLERRDEDFGQTLGRWGLGAGPYIVWPVIGPSSLRDSVGLPLDRSASPVWAVHGDAAQAGLVGLNLVDTRSRLLGATGLIDELALDRYSFVRNAYLARRRSQVYDGEPPDTYGDEGDEVPREPGAEAPR